MMWFFDLFYVRSVEDIREIVFLKQFDVLLVSDTKALEQIIKIGLTEIGWILEAGHVVLKLEVVLDGFDNVALTLKFE